MKKNILKNVESRQDMRPTTNQRLQLFLEFHSSNWLEYNTTRATSDTLVAFGYRVLAKPEGENSHQNQGQSEKKEIIH
jgi:hypothetical protein